MSVEKARPERIPVIPRLLLWILLFCLLGPQAMAAAELPDESPQQARVLDTASDDPSLDRARKRLDSGHLRAAVEILQQAIQEDGDQDPRRLARRLGTLGIALNQVGAYGEAIVVQHHALALYESINDPAGVSAVTINLGNSLSALGDTSGAKRYFERALAQKKENGIRRGVGAIHNNLADLAEKAGDLDRAETALQKALVAYDLESNPSGESLARSNLARILAMRGEHEAALEQIDRAETIARANGFERGVLAIQAAHAEVLKQYVRQSELEPKERSALLAQADASLQQALASSRARDDDYTNIRLLGALSELRQMENQPEQALLLLQEARSLDSELQKSTALTRANVLSVRYEYDRQQREIANLQTQEALSATQLKRHKISVWSLSVLLLMALVVIFALWRRTSGLRSIELQQQQLNQSLNRALERAKEQVQRSEAFALRQRRFLRLASEDLREPLLEIRALAERALVTEGADSLRRSGASIAQRAADLVWVTDQMLESAGDEMPSIDTVCGRETVDLVSLLRELLAEAMPRALHRDQSLAQQSTLISALVNIERVRCSVALRELIDILLYLNPARVRFEFSLDDEDGVVRIGLDAGVAHLPDWQDIALGRESGDVTLRLALAWIQHTIEDNDGLITSERANDSARREVVIRFPRIREPSA